ncbi:MAG: hypothetical protein PUF01_06180 [Eubacteriales bacterium]|nr:hypothetical protein [Eubacteriales bacterium]
MKTNKKLKSKYFLVPLFWIVFVAAVITAAHFMTAETNIVKASIDEVELIDNSEYSYFYIEQDGKQIPIKCTNDQLSYLTNTRLSTDSDINEANLYHYELQVRIYKFPAKNGKLLKIVDREKINNQE